MWPETMLPNSLGEVFDFLIKNLDYAATVIAVMFAVISTFSSIVAKSFADSKSEEKEVPQDRKENPEYVTRLSELRAELQRQKSIFWWNSKSATTLTFLQYIIGGVLASSYIQDNISIKLVGFLGVLVLISSLLHQRYRPDLHAEHAQRRIHKIRVLIRSIEDDIFRIDQNLPDAPSLIELRVRASAGLADLEQSEIQGSVEIAKATKPIDSTEPA